jgi:hypothetical protein
VNKGFGVFLVSMMMLLTGCGGAEVSEPEFEGVRVLMRYDFDIQEYASVDSAQREMERWVDAYNTESPEDHFSGTIAFADIQETEGGYLGYLDCGDIENFAGVHVYNHGIAWERENQMMVTEAATGEEVTLDESFLASLPESYEIVYGPVESLLMGSDRIILELNGLVRYVSAGWTPEGNQAAADPVELYEQEEGTFAILYEPEGNEAKGTGKYSWVVILVVGAVGIAGILVLSKQEIRGMKDAGN